MCIDCWNERGRPANWSPEIGRALGLVTELYEIHPTGGPLHTSIDDWNLEYEVVPWYGGWSDEDLEALWYGGVLIADLDSGAPAVVEGLGRSTRQICDELAALLSSMQVEDRASVLAYHWGYAPTPAETEER